MNENSLKCNSLGAVTHSFFSCAVGLMDLLVFLYTLYLRSKTCKDLDKIYCKKKINSSPSLRHGCSVRILLFQVLVDIVIVPKVDVLSVVGSFCNVRIA